MTQFLQDAQEAMGRLMAPRLVQRLVAVVFSISFMLIALSLLASEFLRQGPSNILSGWTTRADVISFTQWDEAEDVLRAATELNPIGAEAWLDLAKLMDWHAIAATGVEAERYRERAIGYYREVIERRPRYGAAWALLAKNYWQAGHFIPEGVGAWRRCMELAPYEHDTSALLVAVGLANWKQLSGLDRSHLVTLLRYRRQRHKKLLMPIEKLPLVQHLIEHGSLESADASEEATRG